MEGETCLTVSEIYFSNGQAYLWPRKGERGNAGKSGRWLGLKHSNSFVGVLGVVGKSRVWGPLFSLLLFYDQIFQSLLRGYMRCCPPPPMCIYGLKSDWETGEIDRLITNCGFENLHFFWCCLHQMSLIGRNFFIFTCCTLV